jgi:hypothetical protein
LAFAWVGYSHSTEHFSEGTWFAEQAASFEKALRVSQIVVQHQILTTERSGSESLFREDETLNILANEHCLRSL